MWSPTSEVDQTNLLYRVLPYWEKRSGMAEKAVFSWSGGKDSALALHELLGAGEYDVSELITVVTEGYDRISFHGVRQALLEDQAASIGLPLEKVAIPERATMQEYESRMREALERHRKAGVTAVAYGDIHLEDVRDYRERLLRGMGMRAVFPVWRRDTREFAHTLIEQGFEAVVTCVDSEALEREFVGRNYDEQFLSKLPPGVDPCGENGEFHTFAHDGPLFEEGVRFKVGDVTLRENRFYYCDLIPE